MSLNTSVAIDNIDKRVVAIDKIFEDAIADAQQGWNSMKVEVNDLKTIARISSEKHRVSEDAISKLTKEIERLHLEKATREDTMKDLYNKNRKMEVDVDRLHSENMDFKTKEIEHLSHKKKLSKLCIEQNTQMKKLEAEKVKLIKDAKELNEEIENQNQQIKALREEKAKMIDAVTILNGKVENLQKEKQRERDLLSSRVRHLEQEKALVTAELSHTHHIIALAKDAVDETGYFCGAMPISM